MRKRCSVNRILQEDPRRNLDGCKQACRRRRKRSDCHVRMASQPLKLGRAAAARMFSRCVCRPAGRRPRKVMPRTTASAVRQRELERRNRRSPCCPLQRITSDPALHEHARVKSGRPYAYVSVDVTASPAFSALRQVLRCPASSRSQLVGLRWALSRLKFPPFADS